MRCGLYRREQKLPEKPDNTFFLWGARQVGKSFLLKQTYPKAPLISLLKNEEFTLYQTHPERLRQRVLATGETFFIIDEIQKVPQLLDEVHYLIEEHKMVFGLCGSSARKVRRSHANLLGGRALRFTLFGLVSKELADAFDLKRLLNVGYMPLIYDSKKPRQLLKAYCSDYLKEEVFDEGLVRKLPPFSRFLEIAALGDTEIVAYETVARDCGVSATTVKSYYEILVDTLLARYLPPYALKPKRRQVLSPKFYFGDVGIVNHLAQRGEVLPRSAAWGKAFENWIHHEIDAYLEYNQREETLSYWRLSSGVEVDFIIGHMKCAIEAKATINVQSDHCRGLHELKADYAEVKRRIIVCEENQSRLLNDGIEVLSVKDFVQKLWGHQLF